jgi:ribosomal-protein-alanine N-acetyltransferase
MPEAVRAVIRFGFGRMELNRIQARCIAENTASARVMEKAGMTYEGTLREYELIKGVYRDMKFYSILRRERRQA